MRESSELKLYSTKKTNDQKPDSKMQSTLYNMKKLSIVQEEVYKISYDGRKHWLGTEGL